MAPVIEIANGCPTATIADPKILIPAIGDSFKKLDPRLLIRNPVMFVVEVVAALTTVLFIRDLITGRRPLRLLAPDHPLALVHGAVREFRRSRGRGPRQGAGRQPAARPRRTSTPRSLRMRAIEPSSARTVARGCELKPGDIVFVEAGDLIPSRWRGHRGRRLGERSRHHRRIRAGDPRSRRRPLGRDRRHAGDLRLDRGAHHGRARARPSSTA